MLRGRTFRHATGQTPLASDSGLHPGMPDVGIPEALPRISGRGVRTVPTTSGLWSEKTEWVFARLMYPGFARGWDEDDLAAAIGGRARRVGRSTTRGLTGT